MGMTCGQQAARLQEVIRTIAPADARRRIANAYRRNSQRQPWQHLLKRFTLETEACYNTGTIAISENTSAVTVTDGVWDVTWDDVPSSRKIMIQGRSEPYDVTAFGSTTTLTIADNYPGDDLTEGSYNLFRDVYPLPTDCGYTKLMALYDPSQRSDIRYPTDRGRLLLFNQPRFIIERAANNGLTGIPYCFMLINQSSETPPRPQIQIYPPSEDVRVYHGWYFRRPTMPTTDADYLDWPSEWDDMHWVQAVIDYYEMPLTHSASMLAVYVPKYAELFRSMKKAMDGNSAMENEIEGTRNGRIGYSPTFYGSSASGSVNWGS